MELTTTEAKKRHSFNYIEYFETQLYYQCVTCSKVVEHEMGYCPDCIKELELNNRQQLFCCKCRQPVIHKRDYFINEKHVVSHYPVNYLACQCQENLWIPFIKNQNFSIPHYRIECFGSDQNFARQVFREIDKQRYEHETVDLSNFTYNPSMTLF